MNFEELKEKHFDGKAKINGETVYIIKEANIRALADAFRNNEVFIPTMTSTTLAIINKAIINMESNGLKSIRVSSTLGVVLFCESSFGTKRFIDSIRSVGITKNYGRYALSEGAAKNKTGAYYVFLLSKCKELVNEHYNTSIVNMAKDFIEDVMNPSEQKPSVELKNYSDLSKAPPFTSHSTDNVKSDSKEEHLELNYCPDFPIDYTRYLFLALTVARDEIEKDVDPFEIQIFDFVRKYAMDNLPIKTEEWEKLLTHAGFSIDNLDNFMISHDLVVSAMEGLTG